MAPPDRTKPTAKPAATAHTKPGRGKVKVSVVNICDPFSMGRTHQQTAMPTSRCPAHRPQHSVSNLKSLSLAPATNKPLTSSRESSKVSELQIDTRLNKDGVSRRRAGRYKQSLRHNFPRVNQLCISENPGPTLNHCLGIQPQHKQILKRPDGSPQP